MLPQLVKPLHDVHQRLLNDVLGFVGVPHNAPDTVHHPALDRRHEAFVISCHTGVLVGESIVTKPNGTARPFVYTQSTIVA